MSKIFAQVGNPVVSGGTTPDGLSFTQSLITQGINILIVVASIYFVFMFLAGGVKWISSGGDKGQVQTARDQLIHSIIGIIVVFSLWAILGIIDNLFGFNLMLINLIPVLPDR